jgi:hypothetical protein
MILLITDLLIMTILITFNTGDIAYKISLITNLLIMTILVTLNTDDIAYNNIRHYLDSSLTHTLG